MVTFHPQGRLGNWLFSFAAMYVYALKHNLQWTVPSTTNDTFHNPVYYQHLVNPNWDSSKVVLSISEVEYYMYSDLLFDEEWRDTYNIKLKGYFQNPKYFEGYRDQILSVLIPQGNHFNPGTVSVHVRRGDYLKLQHKHPLITKEWYDDAMSLFKGYQFCFFSDDIDWCIEQYGHRADCSFTRGGGGKELENLLKISNCQHHINSASTFSWWGAWLNINPDKKVICPQRWLTQSHSNQWTEEIVPKEWIRI